jgi:cytoskeletal protein CcmA (bactofilin family)
VGDARKSREVEGFRVVQAVRLAKEHAGGRPAPPAEPPPAPRPPPDREAGKAARFGKTALPTKHETACYLCGYIFNVVGSPRRLVCPKCHRELDQIDYTIESECSYTIRTTGAVRIAPSGTLKGADITAREVTVQGRVSDGALRAHRRIEIACDTSLDAGLLEARDLRIAEGCAVRLTGDAVFRNVDIHGALTAHLEASGVVIVHAGGTFAGQLSGRHLVVEEGGGLSARLSVGSPDASPSDGESG